MITKCGDCGMTEDIKTKPLFNYDRYPANDEIEIC